MQSTNVISRFDTGLQTTIHQNSRCNTLIEPMVTDNALTLSILYLEYQKKTKQT